MIKIAEQPTEKVEELGLLALKYQKGDERAFEELLSKIEGYRIGIVKVKHARFPGIFVDDIETGVLDGIENAAKTWRPDNGYTFKRFLSYKVDTKLNHWFRKAYPRRKVKIISFTDLKTYFYQNLSKKAFNEKGCHEETYDDYEYISFKVPALLKELESEKCITKRDKKLIYMRYGLGIKTKDIRNQLNLSHKHTCRILKNLREKIGKKVRGLEILFKPEEFMQAIRDWYHTQNNIKVFEDTEEFPEKTIANLILDYRNGSVDALGEIYKLTENQRNQIANIKEFLLPRNVHRMDIETGLIDAMIYFAETFDFEDYSQKGAIEKYFRKIAYDRCMKWVYRMYPRLRRKLYAEKIKSIESVREPFVNNPLEEKIEKEYLENKIAKVLDSTSERDREIFRQKFFLGKKIYKIAEHMKVPEKAYHRAVKRIKKKFLEETKGDDVILNLGYISGFISEYFSSDKR